MKPRNRVLVTLLVGGLLISGLWFFAKAITSLTGYTIGSARFDTFAKCLTEKGAVLYTSKACESCNQQKAIFKDSYQYLTVINCDEDPSTCDAQEIKYGPVWIINKQKYFGLHGVPRLAEITGCEV